MAVIFYGAAQPDSPMPPGLEDKPTHWIAYTILGVLVVRAVAGGLPRRITVGTALVAMAVTIAHGAAVEIEQMFVPGRFADWNDLAADAIGAAIGAVLCWLWGIISTGSHDIAGPPRHGL